MAWRTAALARVLLGAGLLSGCGLAAGGTTVVIRVVNAVPATTALDFILAGTTFASNVSFKDITTYSYVTEGDSNTLAVMTGSSTVVVPQQKLSLNQPVETIVAAGLPGSTTTPPQFFTFTDNNSSPSRDQISVRLINVSPDSGAVDVTLGTMTIGSNIAYGNASLYTTLPAGQTSVTVIQTGSTTMVASRTLTPLEGGHVYTLIVEGQLANSSTSITAQRDI